MKLSIEYIHHPSKGEIDLSRMAQSNNCVSISRGSKITSHFSENPMALPKQDWHRLVGLCRKQILQWLLGKGLHSPALERCREAGAAPWHQWQLQGGAFRQGTAGQA